MNKLVYDDNGKLERLETWGGSTKHPDAVFYYKDFKKSPIVADEYSFWNIYQFIVECASKMTFPPHTYGMVRFANDYLTKEVAREDECSIEEARETLGIVSLS